MEKYRVIVDGSVYTIPKSKVGSQAEADAAVRSFLRDNATPQARRTPKPELRAQDVLASVTQGLTRGGSDELFGRAEAFIRNKPAKDIIARRRDDVARAYEASPLGYIAGEIAGSIPTTIAQAALMRGRGGGTALQRSIAAGVTDGAMGGFLTGEGDALQRAPGAAFGAAAGGVLGGLGETVTPRITAAGRRLMERGMPETPEMLGRGAKAVMGGLRQAPFIGGVFRDRADETAAQAAGVVARSITDPIGETLEDTSSGLAAFNSVKGAVGRAYDKLFDGKTVDVGRGLEEEAMSIMDVDIKTNAAGKTRLVANNAPGLEERDIDQVLRQVRLLDNEFGTGVISASSWKRADSELRKLIEELNPNNPQVTLQEGRRRQAETKAVQYKKLREWLEKRADEKLLAETRKIDLARKSQETIETAALNMARRDMGPEAVMSANDIARAVRSNSTDQQVLQGNALLQDVASDLKTVYGPLEYNSARDNALLNAIGANAPFLSGIGSLGLLGVGVGLDGVQQQDLTTAGLGAGSLGLLRLLAVPGAYRNLSPVARNVLGGRFGLGTTLQYSSPYVGMQLGKAANQGTEN